MRAAINEVEYVNTVAVVTPLLTCASIFGGGGGWEVGARAAGLMPLWSIEFDADIAGVHAMNFPESNVIVADAREVDPSTLDRVDVLFASPPCQAHSNARSKKLAPREDADVGLCVVEYLRILRPRRFFMENVEGYKRSSTYKAIINALHSLGYWTDSQVINAADYGVPQTRRRLIVRASLDGFPAPLPNKVEWVGWYEAIEDLIPTLPESKFADWQLKRLGMLDETQIVRSTDQLESVKLSREDTDPIWTLTTGNTIHGMPRAFICDGQQMRSNKITHDSLEPTRTVIAHDRPSHLPKAMLLMTANTQIEKPTGTGLLEQGDPANTVLSNSVNSRALIVEGSVGGDRPPTVRQADQPLFTYTSNNGTNRLNPTRASIDGRVVAMTPRALARFQSFPDDFVLPTKTSLACKVIGNAVCPLLAQRLIEVEL